MYNKKKRNTIYYNNQQSPSNNNNTHIASLVRLSVLFWLMVFDAVKQSRQFFHFRKEGEKEPRMDRNE